MGRGSVGREILTFLLLVVEEKLGLGSLTLLGIRGAEVLLLNHFDGRVRN